MMRKLLKKGPMHGIRLMNSLFLAAEEEAHRVGEPRPGAEHLVLAAMDMPDGTARRALARVGADPDAFRAALERLHDHDLRAAGITVDSGFADVGTDEPSGSRRPFTKAPPAPAAQKLFKTAAKLARKDKADLYGAYILVVAARTENGTTARTFRSMDLDLNLVESAALAEIDEAHRIRS